MTRSSQGFVFLTGVESHHELRLVWALDVEEIPLQGKGYTLG